LRSKRLAHQDLAGVGRRGAGVDQLTRCRQGDEQRVLAGIRYAVPVRISNQNAHRATGSAFALIAE
jgi:hypothetical protein